MKKATLYIDARDFQKVRDGKSRVCTEWIQSALKLDWSPWNLCLVTQEPLPLDQAIEEESFVTNLVLPYKGFLWHWKLDRELKKRVKTEALAYFSLNSYFGPVLAKKHYPSAILVHDLIALKYPRAHSVRARLIESFLLKKACHFAKAIYTVSSTTKADLLSYFSGQALEEKTHLFPLAVSQDQFFPSQASSLKNAQAATESATESASESAYNSYILFVGNPIPRKNLDFILSAMAGSLQETLASLHLIVTGSKSREKKYYEALIKKKYAGLQARIHFLPAVDSNQLRLYYQEAHALVFPSLYEGFGLPILEAMACACPVIYHDASSMREVAGTAGLGIRLQEKELETALLSLFDSETRVILKQRALERASEFHWSESLHTFITTFLKDHVSRNENSDT